MVENSSEKKITSPEKCTETDLSTTLTNQTIELNFVRNRLETFQHTVLRDVQKRMSSMIDEVMQELRQHEFQTNEFRNFATPNHTLQRSSTSNTWSNRVHLSNSTNTTINDNLNEITNKEVNKGNACQDLETLKAKDQQKEIELAKLPKKYYKLPEKVFRMRESFLTALLEVDHMKTIYHIFYIIFFVFLSNNISYEYFVNGKVSFGLATFKSGFENIHYIAGVWVLQHLFVFSIYYALKGWSSIRFHLTNQPTIQHIWSVSCLVVYVATQLIFAYIPTQICLRLHLPFVTASVLLLESVRLLMKMHSFVRTIAPRVVSGKLKTEHDATDLPINVPAFNRYLYYLFAPTLLYRDDYPRTSTIRWKFVLARFSEVVAVAFLYSYIYERHIRHHFAELGKVELNAGSVTIKLFGMLMPSIVIFLCGFYLILHAWLNFTAELLRFGDRMFYRDWWTATNYEAFFRNWNVVVHDWLYEYIYKDLYNCVFKGSKSLSSLSVFFISALVHEYIVGFALQLVFPVMFVFFAGVGMALRLLTRYTPTNLGNIVVWFSLIYGNCLMISLYSMEYFTRLNCPKEFNSWTDYITPYLWSCHLK